MYFTADPHFGHPRVSELAHRPYSSVEEMNEALIEQWNLTVPENQDVYCLGDFVFYYDLKKIRALIGRLRGRLKFVLGNHDHVLAKAVGQDIPGYREVKYNKRRFVLSHYPMRTWNGSYRDSVMLYGHSHGNIDFRTDPDTGQRVFTPYGRSMDVGVDAAAAHGLGYRPIHIDEVLALVGDREPVLHHY